MSCPTCGNFETAHVSLCVCPPFDRLARRVDVLADDTLARFSVQHALIMELRETVRILEARISDLEAKRLDDQREMRSVLNRLDDLENRSLLETEP